MKTKNIFRMLLVAAALLMGANNVKADNVTLPWSNPDGQYEVRIAFNAFKNVPTSAILHITYKVTVQPSQWSSPDYGFTIKGKNGSTIVKDCNYTQTNCDIALSEFASIINTDDEDDCSITVSVKDYGLLITGVEIISSTPAPSANDYITVDAISHGYRTYVTTQAINFGGSQNIEGYYASEVSGNNVVFTKVTGVCASDVPLLLVKTGSGDCKLLKSSDTGTEPPTNFLHPGETVNGQGKVVNDSRQYVLTWHNNAPVFAETNVNAARVDAEHAYLVLPSNASGRLRISFKHDDDDLTGIQSLQSDERSLDRAVYNLRGQRVEHPTKGIYIINGKKVIIK